MDYMTLKREVAAVLLDVPNHSIPLFKFREMFEKRYRRSVSTSDLYRMRDVVLIMDSSNSMGIGGRTISLSPDWSIKSADGLDFFCRMHPPSLHSGFSSTRLGWAEKEIGVTLPNVEMDLRVLSGRMGSMLDSHHGEIPLFSCENANPGKKSNIEDKMLRLTPREQIKVVGAQIRGLVKKRMGNGLLTHLNELEDIFLSEHGFALRVDLCGASNIRDLVINYLTSWVMLCGRADVIRIPPVSDVEKNLAHLSLLSVSNDELEKKIQQIHTFGEKMSVLLEESGGSVGIQIIQQAYEQKYGRPLIPEAFGCSSLNLFLSAFFSQKWNFDWDKREPFLLPEKNEDSNNNIPTCPPLKSTATRHLYLIRHGQYEMEAVRDCNRKLTKIGHEQAKLTGMRLSQLGVKFTHFHVSNMTRALETAGHIKEELKSGEFKVDPMLKEGRAVPAEPPTIWNPEDFRYPSGPRIEDAFQFYIHRADPDQTEDSHEIVVCHANVIRYFICRALQFSASGWDRLTLGNGSITRLCIPPSGRVELKSLSETGHMDPEFITIT